MRCWIALHTCLTTEAGPAPLDPAWSQRAAASMALGFTPRVTLLDEAVLLDVTGSLRLFGGLTRLMALLDAQLTPFFAAHAPGLQTRRAQGASSLIALARLRSQAGEGGAVKKRVGELPMETLSAARPHLGVLERTGCRNWDDLLALPRDGMARRFGPELLEALDRARGQSADDYEWLTLPEQFEEKLELDALVTEGPALMAGVERLLPALQAWLIGRQSGLSALRLTWHFDRRRDVAPTGELELRTDKPAQDLRHLARLVAEHLAQQNLAAPVHSLTLQSLTTELIADSAAATTSLLLEARRQGGGAIELVERLSARLGDAQVLSWAPGADHRPEQMQRWAPARHGIKAMLAPVHLPRSPRRQRAAVAAPVRTDALYPSWLLPQPLQLATHGNSPVWQGRLVRLTGPQRLEAAEWQLAEGQAEQGNAELRDKPEVFRDYYIYRSEQGSLLWIYSARLSAEQKLQPRKAWYLHGFFA